MLTEEEIRNGLINPPSHSTDDEVPFSADDVFSEYCNTKVKVVCGAWRELSMIYDYRFSCSTYCSFSGLSNGGNYLSLTHKTLTHSHTHSHIKPTI